VRNFLSGFVWIALYLFFCLAPLLLVIGQDNPPGRPFLVQFSVALGFVGLSILALQFALIARFRPVAAPFGIDALLKYHVQITFVAVAFAFAHPILLFVADSKYLPLLNLITAPWRARFAFASVIALVALVVLSMWRRRLKVRYEVWHISHSLLAVAVVLFALLHVSLVGFYVTGIVRHVVYDGYIGGLVFLLVWTRLISPLIRYRRPWRIVEVRPEYGDASTLIVAPVGHPGFRFDPGQFGWIAVGRSPFSITQHPFSFSSAADTPDGGTISITIKAAGDFTKTIPSVALGTRVYLDGPHGVFSMDRRQAPGYVFIAGGVGVTPFYSMLATMKERDDVRPVTLFYASAKWDEVILRDQLADLEATMPNLTIVHVLSRPEPSWEGESGRITTEVLRRHLPPQFRRYEYLICGATQMMDAMEDALVDADVPAGQISSERFDMV
jgi:predicted ferric reductase